MRRESVGSSLCDARAGRHAVAASVAASGVSVNAEKALALHMERGERVMRNRCIGMGLALVLVGVFAGTSLAIDMGVMTGSDKGTYYQFGLNMQRLVKQRDIDLSVYTSKGSVENVYAVYQRPRTQLGIVQSDVLAFVSRVQTDPVLKRIAKKVKMVFPLYNEEIHVLGRQGITDFDDLADRRVAIGREGSGTYLTARLLFKVSEVQPKEMVLIDTDEALAELKAGRIDAMFYVAGYPVKLLAEGVTETDGLALIPIFNKSVTEFYPVVQIPAKTYAWQSAAVDTVAVKSVLVSYDFRRLDCDYVGRFAQIVSTNLEWLKKNGHPKWQSVDLDFPLKGWEQYDCVKKYVGKSAPVPARPKASINPVMDAIKEILGE
jgi:TRAP transporter TAXI family solute receptor